VPIRLDQLMIGLIESLYLSIINTSNKRTSLFSLQSLAVMTSSTLFSRVYNTEQNKGVSNVCVKAILKITRCKQHWSRSTSCFSFL